MIARVNLGACHIGECLFRHAVPELYAAVIRDVSGFARAVTSGPSTHPATA